MTRHGTRRHLATAARRRGRRRRAGALGAAAVALALAFVLGGAIGAFGGTRRPAGTQRDCPSLFVPAFFSPGSDWSAMATASPPPSVVILDLTSLGAGSAPEPAFQAPVAALQAKGVDVLGYSSTSYATRPIAQIVQDARDYAAWYGVHNIFLDEVTSDAAHLAYYRELDAAIRAVDPGATIWLNPGTYPAPAYLSLGDVVMAFEGPWSSFVSLRVPGWVRRYPTSSFAFVVYDAPAGDLTGGWWLARHRHDGYLYVTDGTGGNPYGSLPSYFTAEDAQAVGCGAGG